MKIKDIIFSKDLTLSFEIFPPKKSDNEETYQNIKKAATEISKIGPDFMSVTCGAGGGTSKQTLPMVQYLESNCHVTAIEHLTCVSSTKEDVHNQLVEMKKLGIGTMRLPVFDKNKPGEVDLEQFKQMVDLYMENGFTYFDTAWMYRRYLATVLVLFS